MANRIAFVEPKTPDRRNIDLADRHQARRAEQRLALRAVVGLDLGFTDAIGEPMPESTLRVA